MLASCVSLYCIFEMSFYCMICALHRQRIMLVAGASSGANTPGTVRACLCAFVEIAMLVSCVRATSTIATPCVASIRMVDCSIVLFAETCAVMR